MKPYGVYIIVAAIIVLEVLGQTPGISLVISLAAALVLIVVFIRRIFPGRPIPWDKVRLAAVVLFAFPASMQGGALMDRLAMRQAEQLRLALLARDPKVRIEVEYQRLCQYGASGYCGIGSYRIWLTAADGTGPDRLHIMGFLDKRTVIDVATGKVLSVRSY